jgi:hypothetical protein
VRARAATAATPEAGGPRAVDPALLCSVDGCTHWWTSDHGRKLCGFHSRGLAPSTKPLPLQTPTHAAARHWQDTEEDDGQPLPF